MIELGNKIAKKRKDMGMTQNEFAEKLLVTRQTVSRWEAGSVLPDIDKISDIASLLGVSCDYLLKDEIKEENKMFISDGPGKVLQEALGKKIRLRFFDEEADSDLYNTDCVIESFEGNWASVRAETKKGSIQKLIPLSSVLSVEYVKEED
ncbi:MAG: helix-turn-helix transcriptional regulator [Erysipelotrichaceae bacterium]|nr:helix-turn-helix transcriptional regulator [Erysipelotrichaceae bacterium]